MTPLIITFLALWLIVMAFLAKVEATDEFQKVVERGQLYPSWQWNHWFDAAEEMRTPFRYIFTLMMMTFIYIMSAVMLILSGLIFRNLIFKTKEKVG